MANKEIVDYLKKGLKRGFPFSELKQSLLAKNYFDIDIDEAIKEVKSTAKSSKKELAPVGKKVSFFTPKFIFFSLLSLFATFAIVFMAIGNGPGSTIVLNEGLSEGISVDLMQNKVELDVDGKTEELGVDTTSEDSVFLNFGEDGEESMGVGEQRILDLNGDSIDDLIIRLDSITDGIPKVYFEKIEYDIKKAIAEEEGLEYEIDQVKVPEVEEGEDLENCKQDVVCSEWGDCSSEGVQERECEDKNECGREISELIPLKISCIYQDQEENVPEICKEDWVCGDWTECNSLGKQVRDCEDINECGLGEHGPDLERNCLEINDPETVNQDPFLGQIVDQTGDSTSYSLDEICRQYESDYGEVVYFRDDESHFCQDPIVKIEENSSCCSLNNIVERPINPDGN